MGIGTIGGFAFTDKLYSYNTSVKKNTSTENKVGSTRVFEVTSDKKNEQTDPVMDLYKSICEKYPDVSFRLDDQAARLDYEKKNGTNCCPYLGYNNSSNQVGDNFGKMSQKSVEIDVSVLQKSLDDPKYFDEFMFYLDEGLTDSKYNEWKQMACGLNATNMCLGFKDDNGRPAKYATNSNCEFATDEEIRSQWGKGVNKDALLQKINSTNNELIDNYMQLLSEHTQKLKGQLMNGGASDGIMVGTETMRQEEWDAMLGKNET